MCKASLALKQRRNNLFNVTLELFLVVFFFNLFILASIRTLLFQ